MKLFPWPECAKWLLLSVPADWDPPGGFLPPGFIPVGLDHGSNDNDGENGKSITNPFITLCVKAKQLNMEAFQFTFT